MARQKRTAPLAVQTSPAAPAPSPTAVGGSASSTDSSVDDAEKTGALAPVVGALQTQVVADPPAGGTLEQLATVDPATGAAVPPVVGVERLGAVALDASGARIEVSLPQIADAALAVGHLQQGEPAIGSPDVELPQADPAEPASLGLSDVDDEADWRARQLRRMTRPGLPVTFREHDRRFNGLPTTPAIITRVYDDMVVNLMVLPDGGEPYPRMAVTFEAELDPDGLGRAWTHIRFDDD